MILLFSTTEFKNQLSQFSQINPTNLSGLSGKLVPQTGRVAAAVEAIDSGQKAQAAAQEQAIKQGAEKTEREIAAKKAAAAE